MKGSFEYLIVLLFYFFIVNGFPSTTRMVLKQLIQPHSIVKHNMAIKSQNIILRSTANAEDLKPTINIMEIEAKIKATEIKIADLEKEAETALLLRKQIIVEKEGLNLYLNELLRRKKNTPIVGKFCRFTVYITLFLFAC